MKQITITVPDNCELKQDGNTYTIVEKEKKLTYEDVARKLFSKGDIYFTTTSGSIGKTSCENILCLNDVNNAKSKRQLEKLFAINKLMNVAKYLNCDWQPDWTYSHRVGWYIVIREDDKIEVSYSECICGDIYFRTEKLAIQAIEILGEETIRLALCTDY